MFRVEKRWGAILANAIDGTRLATEYVPSGKEVSIRLHNGHAVTFDVVWAGEGWPQDVRLAAAAIPEPWPATAVLLARQLSPGALEWLRARDANWADEAGQVRIVGPDGLTVIREPRQDRGRDYSSPTFAWSKSAIALGEAILTRPDQPLRATELGGLTGWSVAQAAKVLKAFDAQGWTVKRGALRGSGAYRELADLATMLASWSSAVAQEARSIRVTHRTTPDVMGFLREDLAHILDRNTSWAVSGWAGLELAAPFATTTPSLHIYVAQDDFAGPLSDAIDQAGLRQVDEGGRIIFWAAEPNALDLAWRKRDIPIVSAPRLYADLSSLGARGQDAADHVREQLIDPLHPGLLAKEAHA